jgi:hypothetical protein
MPGPLGMGAVRLTTSRSFFKDLFYPCILSSSKNVHKVQNSCLWLTLVSWSWGNGVELAARLISGHLPFVHSLRFLEGVILGTGNPISVGPAVKHAAAPIHTMNIWGWIRFSLLGLHCSLPSSNPGLYSSEQVPDVTTKMSPDHEKCPLRGQIAPRLVQCIMIKCENYYKGEVF